MGRSGPVLQPEQLRPHSCGCDPWFAMFSLSFVPQDGGFLESRTGVIHWSLLQFYCSLDNPSMINHLKNKLMNECCKALVMTSSTEVVKEGYLEGVSQETGLETASH
jgi:hypothetical protein